jgi:hypothetical protein
MAFSIFFPVKGEPLLLQGEYPCLCSSRVNQCLLGDIQKQLCVRLLGLVILHSDTSVYFSTKDNFTGLPLGKSVPRLGEIYFLQQCTWTELQSVWGGGGVVRETMNAPHRFFFYFEVFLHYEEKLWK